MVALVPFSLALSPIMSLGTILLGLINKGKSQLLLGDGNEPEIEGLFKPKNIQRHYFDITPKMIEDVTKKILANSGCVDDTYNNHISTASEEIITIFEIDIKRLKEIIFRPQEYLFPAYNALGGGDTQLLHLTQSIRLNGDRFLQHSKLPDGNFKFQRVTNLKDLIIGQGVDLVLYDHDPVNLWVCISPKFLHLNVISLINLIDLHYAYKQGEISIGDYLAYTQTLKLLFENLNIKNIHIDINMLEQSLEKKPENFEFENTLAEILFESGLYEHFVFNKEHLQNYLPAREEPLKKYSMEIVI